ncbi:MAG: hypothetical protein L0Y56_00670 [Nitrospira sp.]|nr:hypothetical protein [Nitrospira sp.]
MITVKDLKDQTGTPGPHSVLYCLNCMSTYSANRGDYFFLENPGDRKHVFRCCGEPMILVVPEIHYREVSL